MATDALTVKVEFDKENAMNCIKNVLMDEYGMTLDELSELCKAKQEGRMVVLPCKIGDTVYCISPDFDGTEDEPRFCKFKVEKKAFRLHHAEFYGKTVFLDREAAEARLKGVQNDG